MRFIQIRFAVIACLLLLNQAHAEGRHLLVPKAIYTQKGFESEPATQEFKDWQRRFAEDWNVAFAQAEKSGKEEMAERAAEFFPSSIDANKKGLSLKKYLLNAIFAGSGDAVDAGIIAMRMILDQTAHPVGYGGICVLDGYNVEIWYMALHDLGKMSLHDFKAAAAYSAFEKLELPSINSGARGTWPVLLIIRDKDGRLMLYGHSKEMYDISEKASWRQFY